MTKRNIILIDLENIQSVATSHLEDECFEIKVFVGANQSKIPFHLVKGLQPYGRRVEWIQIPTTGPNALDFHISFYIGSISSANSDAFFHIISKDKGFDALIKSLKAQKILCLREESIEDIPIIKAKTSTPAERLKAVKEKLNHGPRPRTEKTLRNSIKSAYHSISDEEITKLINSLAEDGTVSIVDNKIVYNLQ